MQKILIFKCPIIPILTLLWRMRYILSINKTEWMLLKMVNSKADRPSSINFRAFTLRTKATTKFLGMVVEHLGWIQQIVSVRTRICSVIYSLLVLRKQILLSTLKAVYLYIFSFYWSIWLDFLGWICRNLRQFLWCRKRP